MGGAAGARRLRAASAAAAAAGGVLFAWSLRRAGTAAALGGVARIGAGMIVILLLGGARSLIRAAAWRLCLPREHRLPLAAAFSAYLAGDAIGNVTPFGFLISEPSKIVLVRRRTDVASSVAALTVENLFYGITVVLMLVGGTAALLLSFHVPPAVRLASLLTVAVALGVTSAALWIVMTRRRVVSGSLEWLIRARLAPQSLRGRLPRIKDAGDRIFRFGAERRRAVPALLALETGYQAAAVAEIWFALSLITGAPPGLLTAFILEYVNRTITVVFQFVPMWLGVDEAGTSLATSVLNLGPAAGVSLALARKVRVAVWTAVGLALLLWRGATVEATARDARRIEMSR